MPIYDYLCAACGPFTELAPMAAFDEALACPDCGAAAPRAMLTMPNLRGMSTSRFAAHAVNEKSAHAPEMSTKTGRHPPGCGCCRGAPKPVDSKPAAMKTFAGTRPWMISH